MYDEQAPLPDSDEENDGVNSNEVEEHDEPGVYDEQAPLPDSDEDELSEEAPLPDMDKEKLTESAPLPELEDDRELGLLRGKFFLYKDGDSFSEIERACNIDESSLSPLPRCDVIYDNDGCNINNAKNDASLSVSEDISVEAFKVENSVIAHGLSVDNGILQTNQENNLIDNDDDKTLVDDSTEVDTSEFTPMSSNNVSNSSYNGQNSINYLHGFQDLESKSTYISPGHINSAAPLTLKDLESIPTEQTAPFPNEFSTGRNEQISFNVSNISSVSFTVSQSRYIQNSLGCSPETIGLNSLKTDESDVFALSTNSNSCVFANEGEFEASTAIYDSTSVSNNNGGFQSTANSITTLERTAESLVADNIEFHKSSVLDKGEEADNKESSNSKLIIQQASSLFDKYLFQCLLRYRLRLCCRATSLVEVGDVSAAIPIYEQVTFVLIKIVYVYIYVLLVIGIV